MILFQSDLYHRIQLCAMRSWAQVAPGASSNATMTTRTTTAMRRATIHCWRRRLHSGDNTFKYKDNYDMPRRLPPDFSTPYWFYSSSSEAPRASRASRGGARVADRLVASFTWENIFKIMVPCNEGREHFSLYFPDLPQTCWFALALRHGLSPSINGVRYVNLFGLSSALLNHGKYQTTTRLPQRTN